MNSTKPRIRPRIFKRNRVDLPFVYMAPREAAPVLGFSSVAALHAFLRRRKDAAGKVTFPDDIVAQQQGRRWFVRFPVARPPASSAVMSTPAA